jgi:hypothetical protein
MLSIRIVSRYTIDIVYKEGFIRGSTGNKTRYPKSTDSIAIIGAFAGDEIHSGSLLIILIEKLPSKLYGSFYYFGSWKD